MRFRPNTLSHSKPELRSVSLLIDEHQNIVELTTVVTKELVQVVQPGRSSHLHVLIWNTFLICVEGCHCICSLLHTLTSSSRLYLTGFTKTLKMIFSSSTAYRILHPFTSFAFLQANFLFKAIESGAIASMKVILACCNKDIHDSLYYEVCEIYFQ